LDPDAPTPSWVISMGLQVHDPRVPFRVLGYDLALCPEGIQEDWDKLYREFAALANGLLQCNVTLQGWVLLTNMLLTSRLQYKLRLSMPSDTHLRSFQNLAWNTVWKGSKLRSSHLLGQRPRQAGGLGFLAVKTQAIVLHAQWIVQHFSRRTLWSPILQHIFGCLAGGPTSLVVGTKPKLKKIPRAWHSVFKAWYKLHPHWEADPATWTISEA